MKLQWNGFGIDEDQVQEIPPVYLHGYEFEEAPEPTYYLRGADGRSRASKYSSTWLFFSDTQVYIYRVVFDMASDSVVERTNEYFYKDITNFFTEFKSLDVTSLSGCGCMQKASKNIVKTSRFCLIVPGDSFGCSTTGVPNVEQSIQAMKHMLREKKL